MELTAWIIGLTLTYATAGVLTARYAYITDDRRRRPADLYTDRRPYDYYDTAADVTARTTAVWCGVGWPLAWILEGFEKLGGLIGRFVFSETKADRRRRRDRQDEAERARILKDAHDMGVSATAIEALESANRVVANTTATARPKTALRLSQLDRDPQRRGSSRS